MTATLAPPEPPVEELTDALLDDDELLRFYAEPQAGPRRPSLLGSRYEELRFALIWGWVGFILFCALFEPASTGIARPLWVDVASAVLLLGLPAALLAGKVVPGPAYGAAVLLGGLGIALGIACRATSHHTGSWWIVETVGFAALTVLAVASLAAYRVRS